MSVATKIMFLMLELQQYLILLNREGTLKGKKNQDSINDYQVMNAQERKEIRVLAALCTHNSLLQLLWKILESGTVATKEHSMDIKVFYFW